RFALHASGLADAERGTTVVATLAQGGSRPNVVPESATLTLDARVWSQDEARRIEAALHAYRSTDARVGVEVAGRFDRPPLEPSPAASTLYERARGIAAELGFELGGARVGGASDGNLTSAAGVATLDGLGPRGDGAHARHELVVLSDLPPRAALRGKVTDEQGAALTGAAVTARNVDTNAARSVTTGGLGQFFIPNLPAGTYELTAALSGFGTERRPGLVLRVGQEGTVDFTL